MRRNSIFKFIVVSFLAIPFVQAQNPNHLVPLDEDREIFEEYYLPQMNPESFEVGMVCQPSFRGSYGIFILKGEVVDPRFESYKLLARGDLPPKKLSDQFMDTTVRVAFSSLVAQEVIQTWKSAIDLTTWDFDYFAGVDGATYYFATGDSANGQIWSPDIGIPKLLVDCSENLVKYALARAKDRAEIEANILQLCKEPNDECDKEAARREEEK